MPGYRALVAVLPTRQCVVSPKKGANSGRPVSATGQILWVAESERAESERDLGTEAARPEAVRIPASIAVTANAASVRDRPIRNVRRRPATYSA